jgi:hypothetical protein
MAMDKHLGNSRLGLGLGFAPALILGLILGFAASNYWTLSMAWPAPGRGEIVGPAETARQLAQIQADVNALRRSAREQLRHTNSAAQVPGARAAWQTRYGLQLARLEAFERQAVRPKDKDLARALRLELQAQHDGVMKLFRNIEDGAMPPVTKAGRTTALPLAARMS